MIHLRCVVHRIVATARNTGELVRSKSAHHRRVDGVFLKGPGTSVAVQALRVLEATRDGDRVRRRADVLHVNASQALELVLERAIDRVVGVAGITGHVRRHSMVLEMLRRNVCGIVQVKALSIVFHGVARDAEFGLFGALHVCVHPAHDAKSRKSTQPNEGHNLPSDSLCHGRPDQKDQCQYDAEHDLNDENSSHQSSDRCRTENEGMQGVAYFFLPSSRM